MKPEVNDGAAATNGPNTDQPDDAAAKLEQPVDSADVKADMELD